METEKDYRTPMTISLPVDDMKHLDTIATKRHTSKQDLLRLLVKEFLKTNPIKEAD